MRITLLLSLALIGYPLGAQNIQPAQIAPGSNGQVLQTASSAAQWGFPVSANTNTAVVINPTGTAAGSGYVSPTCTLTGGTCSTQPVIQCIEAGGALIASLSNNGACTVVPSVTVTDSGGTGGTVALSLSGNAVAANANGSLASQQQTGAGNAVGGTNPFLYQPVLYNPVLGPSTPSAGYNNAFILCANGTKQTYIGGGYGTSLETAITSLCNAGGNNVVGIRPGAANNSLWGSSDSFHFGAGTNQNGSTDMSFAQMNFFDPFNVGRGAMSFNPCVTSTPYCIPMAMGFKWYLTNPGGTIRTTAIGSGSGYSSGFSCTVTGGTLTSGSAETCTASVTTGACVGTPAGTGVYTTSPTMNVTCNLIAGGTSGFSTLLGIGTADTLTSTLWADLAGTLHYSTADVGTAGSDKLTITNAGVLTVSSCTGCGTVTIGNGTSPLGGLGAIASATCSTITVAVSGVLTTDAMLWSFAGNPTSTVGFQPSTSGMLLVLPFVTANNANFSICNNTSGSITPGTISLNWRIVR